MNAKTSWIQADLVRVHLLISVTTQGREDHDFWTTSYLISYGDDGVTWTTIPTLYSANFDRNTKVTNQLPSDTFGRFVRLRPQDFSEGVGIRWDVRGILKEGREITNARKYICCSLTVKMGTLL